MSLLPRDEKLLVWFLIHQVSKCPYLSFHFLCLCMCCVSIQCVSPSIHAIAYVWRSEVSHGCKPPSPTLFEAGSLVSVCVRAAGLLRLFLFLGPVLPYWDTRAVGSCYHIWLPFFILVWHKCGHVLHFPSPGLTVLVCLRQQSALPVNMGIPMKWRSDRFWKCKSDTSRSFFFGIKTVDIIVASNNFISCPKWKKMNI